jgi:hypothetical protein
MGLLAVRASNFTPSFLVLCIKKGIKADFEASVEKSKITFLDEGETNESFLKLYRRYRVTFSSTPCFQILSYEEVVH